MIREMMMAAYLAGVTSADLIWQRIPNQLIMVGYLMGLMLRIIEEGAMGAVMGLLSGVATIAALYIFYMIGAIGAGDVKLFSVIGLSFGLQTMWTSAFFSLIFAGMAALAFAVRKRQLYIRFYLLFSHIMSCFRRRRFETYSALEQEGYLHFAIYISLGYLFTLFYRKAIP